MKITSRLIKAEIDKFCEYEKLVNNVVHHVDWYLSIAREQIYLNVCYVKEDGSYTERVIATWQH
jgi:hypothetical protein